MNNKNRQHSEEDRDEIIAGLQQDIYEMDTRYEHCKRECRELSYELHKMRTRLSYLVNEEIREKVLERSRSRASILQEERKRAREAFKEERRIQKEQEKMERQRAKQAKKAIDLEPLTF